MSELSSNSNGGKTASRRSFRKPLKSEDEIRVLPHDINTERAVIASILREPILANRAIELLQNEQVFYDPRYRVIFKAILNLCSQEGKPVIDLMTIINQLKLLGQFDELGGEPFLAEVQYSITSTANLDAWINIVKENYILRRMIEVCDISKERCFNLQNDHGVAISPKEVMDTVEKEIISIRNSDTKQGIMSFKKLALNTFSNLQDVMNGNVEYGIPTGYSDLDRQIQGGLKKGELFILAARPSIGKTAFALNMTRNILIKNRTVAFFSLEMTAEQIARRLLCNYARVSESLLVTPGLVEQEKIQSITPKLTRAMDDLCKWKLWVDATPGLSIMELKAKARRLKEEQKIDVIIIDYLQLMKSPGYEDNRQQEVAQISQGLKHIAKELQVPVVALAQLSRESDKAVSPNARPKLSHLRESGAIEQDADIVAFLHRNRDEQKKLKEDSNEGLAAECIIEKNRNGKIGTVNLLFFPQYTDFASSVHKYHQEDRPVEP